MSQLSPSDAATSPTEVFLGYLEYFREQLISSIESLSSANQRASRLSSGWTPVELLAHLRYVELRWLEWGFMGATVTNPWGDRRDGRWFVGLDTPVGDLVNDLRLQAARSRESAR